MFTTCAGSRRPIALWPLFVLAALAAGCGLDSSSDSGGANPPSNVEVEMHAFTTGDIDGDGLEDLLAEYVLFRYQMWGGRQSLGTEIWMLRQDPNRKGTFRSAERLLGSLGMDYPVAAIEDVTGDGYADLLFLQAQIADVFVQAAPPRKTFFPAPSIRSRVDVDSIRSFTLADFDDDGLPDLCLGADVDGLASGEAVVVSGFTPESGGDVVNLTADVDAYVSTAHFEDLDRNGSVDVFAIADGDLLVRLQDPAAPGEFVRTDWYSCNHFAQAVRSGDVDGDGLSDLLVFSEEGPVRRIALRPQDPAFHGTFLAGSTATLDLTPASNVVADFNADGRDDVAFLGRSRADPTRAWITVFATPQDRHDSLGVYRSRDAGPWPDSGYGSARAADLNQDGLTDLVAVSGNDLVVFHQRIGGPGEFLAPVVVFSR